MGDLCDDRHLSADEVVLLRRRIAELERANERLSEQGLVADGQRYHDLVENMNDIIYTTDREGTIRSVNRAVQAVLGFDPGEIIGTHYSRWIPREELGKTETVLVEVRNGGRVLQQIVVADRDGNEHPMETSISPLMVDGRIEGAQGILRDTTARHDAEWQVREREETLRALFNAVTESILLTDIEGRILTLNETAAGRFGRSVDEMIGRRPTDIAANVMPPEVAKGREAVIRRVCETGRAAQFEDQRFGVWFDVNVYPVFDAAGRVASVAVFAKDITERKQAEEEIRALQRQLRASEQRYRAVVETAADSIVIVDAHGVFAFLNTAAGRRLGGRPVEFVGKTMWELFPQDIADAQTAHIRAVIASGRGTTVVTLSSVRGEARWYSTTIEPLRDDAGRVTAALVVARDIHELHTAQQELESYREQMVRAERRASVGTLSAILAHEMTQPLMVLRLSLQNAIQSLQDAAPWPTVREDLQDGLAESSHLTAIVQRLREFTGRLSDRARDRISLAATAAKVMRLLEESARKARVALEVHRLEELPPIEACGKDIEQVFFALAQNAIHAADGARDHFFRVRGARRDGGVELQFADDCGGIAPEVLEHLFEPFVTTKPAGEGTGLGLCLVERIVSQAGGRLRVDSQGGRGTTFFITLPVETK